LYVKIDKSKSIMYRKINTKIEIMSNSHSFDDFKINVRDWRIGKLVDEKE
jgi:hypothetical protein